MMITSFQPVIYNNSSSRISFGSSMREYNNDMPYALTGSKIYTTTQLFRKDLDFEGLADCIIDGFKDKKKVNIKCLAGSDGSEAYSTAIALMEKVPPNKRGKYLPIQSLDRDKVITETAQQGKINLSKLDFEALSKVSKSGKKYFVNKKEKADVSNDFLDSKYYSSYEPVLELRKAVNFKTGNLINEIENLEDDGNSVIMCRNVMPYLHPSQVSNIAYNINEKLKSGSMFVIGDFDSNTKIRDYLYYYGFVERIDNVFVKP